MESLDAWKLAGTTADVDRALTALAPDAELVSPLTDRFSFRGRAEIGQLLEAVFEVASDYRYEHDLRTDAEAFLTLTARVRDVELHEFQHLRLDHTGRITTITLTMRPLVALTALARALGPVLARKQGSPGKAHTIAVGSAFLDLVARRADSTLSPTSTHLDHTERD